MSQPYGLEYLERLQTLGAQIIETWQKADELSIERLKPLLSDAKREIGLVRSYRIGRIMVHCAKDRANSSSMKWAVAGFAIGAYFFGFHGGIAGAFALPASPCVRDAYRAGKILATLKELVDYADRHGVKPPRTNVAQGRSFPTGPAS